MEKADIDAFIILFGYVALLPAMALGITVYGVFSGTFAHASSLESENGICKSIECTKDRIATLLTY